MGESLQKAFFGVIALGVAFISIVSLIELQSIKEEKEKLETSQQKTFAALESIRSELIPVSRQASSWNRCLDGTTKLLDKSPELNGWDKKGKESLAVAICNGAVYEPKLETE